MLKKCFSCLVMIILKRNNFRQAVQLNNKKKNPQNGLVLKENFVFRFFLLGVVPAWGGKNPMPAVPSAGPPNSVQMGDWKSFPEMKLDIPVAPGPFEPTWESIEKNYPGEPAWLRDAKFGIWVHFGPQSAGESGDWYARNLYKPGKKAYDNHLKKYGHPSAAGYKEVLRDWNPTKLDPAKLTKNISRCWCSLPDDPGRAS